MQLLNLEQVNQKQLRQNYVVAAKGVNAPLAPPVFAVYDVAVSDNQMLQLKSLK